MIHLQSLETFIHRKVVVLHQNISARDAARVMADQEIGCVLVIDDQNQMTGIVTDRDFACRLVAVESHNDVPLSKIMTTQLITADEDSALSDVVKLMERHGVRRVPILSSSPGRSGRCIGLVTLDDLILAQAIDYIQLCRIVKKQIGKRLLVQPVAAQERAESRSQAHQQQTLTRFYKQLEEKTGLSSELIPDLSQYLIESLIRRITYTSAMHLVSQFPKFLQESLMEVEPGPDRSVTSEVLMRELGKRFQFTTHDSTIILSKFFSGLEEIIDSGRMKNIKVQLPEDLRKFFKPMKEFVPGEPLGTAELGSMMQLRCLNFKDGEEIPKQFTGEGADRSPALEWTGAPRVTKEFALICEDPDALDKKPWVHWILYHIPPTVSRLPEGFPPVPKLEVPVQGTQGRNSFGNIGYEGPMPPGGHGLHHYYFRLYALDREVRLPPGATKQQLLHEMRGHVLAEAVLMGRYQRGSLKKAA